SAALVGTGRDYPHLLRQLVGSVPERLVLGPATPARSPQSPPLRRPPGNSGSGWGGSTPHNPPRRFGSSRRDRGPSRSPANSMDKRRSAPWFQRTGCLRKKFQDLSRRFD